MKLNFRMEQKLGRDEPIKPIELATIFQETTKQLDILLGVTKMWYEQGYSRKQALQHKIFTEQGISSDILNRWDEKYKKEYPNWTTGIWDGGPDEDSAGIDCYPSYSSTGRRKNPINLVITFDAEMSNVSW